MPRPLASRVRRSGPRRTAALARSVGIFGGLVATLSGSAFAQQPARSNATGVVQPAEQRAPAILGEPAAPAGQSEIVDESALRYYAASRQTARVEAEIRRLRRRYPNWTVPTDLDTLKPSPPEEAPLWDLFTAGRFDDLRNAITARQTTDPDWQPSEDLARKLNRGTFRAEVKAAAEASAWPAIVTRIQADPDAMRAPDIDIAWLVAEAYARTGQPARAADVYRGILGRHGESTLRTATIQKAMSLLPIARVELLLALGRTAADGASEFRPIQVDITRARIVGFLHDEPVERIDPADLAAFGEQARRAGEPSQIALLGWYAYRRHEFRDALEWFKTAIARGGDATVAHGLALSLRDTGQEREAEEVAFAWRGPSTTNTILYLDLVERRLNQPGAAPLEPARLDRYAKVTLATASGEGAQALGWYAYKACQFDAALEWFQRATAWMPRESVVIGYAVTLERLKRMREYYEVLNRYDGLFPKVVDLAFKTGVAATGIAPCTPGRAVEPAVASPTVPPVARVPRATTAAPVERGLPVKRSDFPVAVASENPLRFWTVPGLPETSRDSEYLRDGRMVAPLVAHRVIGVGVMPYESYGYTLLPAWNGVDRPSLQPGVGSPPAGTLAQSEPTSEAPSYAGGRAGVGREGDRFAPFTAGSSASRAEMRALGQDR
jgi:cellulose synthase operon protein C